MNDSTPASTEYAGLVTRGVALVIDAVVIDLIAVVLGAAVHIIVTALGGSGSLNLVGALAGGFAWLLWSGAYFVAFWTVTGQTPGGRLMRIRVVGPGGRVGFVRALRRFGGLVLCTVTLGLGFLPVLFDERRRGLHDRLAGTVVRWDDVPSGPQADAESRSAPGAESGPAGSPSTATAVRVAG